MTVTYIVSVISETLFKNRATLTPSSRAMQIENAIHLSAHEARKTLKARRNSRPQAECQHLRVRSLSGPEPSRFAALLALSLGISTSTLSNCEHENKSWSAIWRERRLGDEKWVQRRMIHSACADDPMMRSTTDHRNVESFQGLSLCQRQISR